MTSEQKAANTITFEDYGDVDRLMLPYKLTSYNPGNGNVVSMIKLYKQTVSIDDKRFTTRKVK